MRSIRCLPEVKKLHPALQHAAYSATTILPGESATEFEKLHKDLVAEFNPDGPSESDIVETMARLLWRKQHLSTFRMADLARRRCDEIKSKIPGDQIDYFPQLSPLELVKKVDPVVRQTAARAAEDQIEKELGELYTLVELGDAATIECLMKDLDVQDRLDAMIEKCIKRLLMVRGVKSLSLAPSSGAPSSGPAKRLAAPSKAA